MEIDAKRSTFVRTKIHSENFPPKIEEGKWRENVIVLCRDSWVDNV